MEMFLYSYLLSNFKVEKSMAKIDDIIAKIRFIYENKKKVEDEKKIVEILDEALKKGGDFDVYGDLSSGIENLVEVFRVTVTVSKKEYFIDCGPFSGSGHDFQFSINKKSKSIDKNSVCVGEVIQPPDDE